MGVRAQLGLVEAMFGDLISRSAVKLNDLHCTAVRFSGWRLSACVGEMRVREREGQCVWAE